VELPVTNDPNPSRLLDNEDPGRVSWRGDQAERLRQPGPDADGGIAGWRGDKARHLGMGVSVLAPEEDDGERENQRGTGRSNDAGRSRTAVLP
jgi:hypothetical protein